MKANFVFSLSCMFDVCMYVCTRNSCVHCFEIRIDFSSIGRESAEEWSEQQSENPFQYLSLCKRSTDRSSTKFSILVHSVADQM